MRFLLKLLPVSWDFVRRGCGGHWETRARSVFHPDAKRYMWWEQFDECQYRTWPPAIACEDHGPIKVDRRKESV